VELQAKLPNGLRQGAEEDSSISVSPEDGSPFVASSHDVVRSAFEFDANGPSHSGSVYTLYYGSKDFHTRV